MREAGLCVSSYCPIAFLYKTIPCLVWQKQHFQSEHIPGRTTSISRIRSTIELARISAVLSLITVDLKVWKRAMLVLINCSNIGLSESVNAVETDGGRPSFWHDSKADITLPWRVLAGFR